jgi:hypothetical protein
VAWPDHLARSRPSRAARLVEATVRNRRVLYDPARRRLLELRADVDAMWSLFDGVNELEELALEMAEVSGLDEESVRSYLAELVADLDAAGLLEPHEPGRH